MAGATQKLVEIDEESFWCISESESSDPTDSIAELLPGSQFSNEIFAVRIKGSCLQREAGLIICVCVGKGSHSPAPKLVEGQRGGPVTDTHICNALRIER